MGNIKQTSASGEESIIKDDTEKSNAFVEYFSSVYTLELLDNFDNLKQIIPANAMQKLIITEKDVYQKLAQLKVTKSPGPDMICPRVLKEAAVQVTTAMKYLFDISLKWGILPDDWKCSVVTAIHKKGSKSCMSNYRPISLTCIICKILESLVRDHIMNYFLQNNLFSSRLFGFIPRRLTALKFNPQWLKN